MKTIKLKKIILTDFRGQTREVEFKDGLTEIVGFNGTGKSTIYEAFLWCLTGSDSMNRTNYDLFDNRKEFTYENSTPAIVDVITYVDGIVYAFRRQAKQKWVRKRGQAVYTKDKSDEYKFYIDTLELSATSYRDRVSEIFGMDMEKLKLALNIRYYQMLDWKELRKHFSDLVGDITNADFKGNYSDIQEYLTRFNGEGAKEYIRQQITPLKKQVEQIEADIKATKRTIPDLTSVEEAKHSIEEKKHRIEEINREILGLEEANKPFVAKRDAESVEIEALKSEYREKEREYKDRYRDAMAELERELYDANRHNDDIEAQKKRNEQAIARHNADIHLCKEDIEDMENDIVKLREQNKELKSREFSDTVCPNCGQELPADMIAELRKKFYEDIDKQRAPIVERGKALAIKIEERKQRLAKLEKEEVIVTDSSAALIDTDEIKSRIERCHDDLIPFEGTPEAKELLTQLEEKESALTVVPEVNSAELREESARLVTEIEELSKITALESIADKALSDIADYEYTQKEVGISLAKWEGLLGKMMEREREWADIVRDRANKYLKHSHVEMLELSKAGEVVDTCTLTINGVDRGVTNHANKTIIGIDISNAFCERYGITMPLFIDDFEHFTSELEIAEDRQTVTLSADKHYPDLTIL